MDILQELDKLGLYEIEELMEILSQLSKKLKRKGKKKYFATVIAFINLVLAKVEYVKYNMSRDTWNSKICPECGKYFEQGEPRVFVNDREAALHFSCVKQWNEKCEECKEEGIEEENGGSNSLYS